MQNYEPDVSQLLALYQQLEDDIIADMVRRMLKMGFVSESTAYQAEVLQTAGILYDDIIAMIAQRTDASVEQVKALFEDAGVETVEIDNEIHEEAGEAPVDIRQDSGMKQVLEAGYKKTLGTMRNLVSTTASTTQKAFLAACDRAYMQVSSGAFSYQQAIRMAVKNLADSGAYVTYPTGHKDRIDVAVRRCVLTGVGQTASAVAKKRAEDSGCDYMELTAHSGARPEHAKWQGQLVRIRGNGKEKVIDGLKVFTLHEIGYGKGDGFKGWNCRHNWHPYYPGLSTPNYTQAELKKLDEKSISYNGKKYTEYEVSQMQRTAERKVRALKRRTLAAQTAVEHAPDEDTRMVLQTEYMVTAAKLKDSERILNDFCRQTGRRRDAFREQVNGFGKSEAQKAVHAAKKIPEKALTFGGNGGIINMGSDSVSLELQRYGRNKNTLVNKTYIESGEYRRKFDKISGNDSVNRALYSKAKEALQHRSGTVYEDMFWIDSTSGNIILEVTDSIVERAILYTDRIKKTIRSGSNIITLHTHPSSMPPSISDFNSCYKNNYKQGIVACHDGKIFAYTSKQEVNETLYNMYIESYIKEGYSEFDSQIKAIEKIKQNYDIDFWEVK